MGFKGSLASINLADIFQNLALNQQTGTIRITTSEENYYVYFEKGAVALFSRDKDKGGKLGEMVVGRGLAGLEQIDEALRKQQSTGRLLGEILVDMNILSKEDVANLIKYQIEEAVYDLFHLDDGEFEFVDGAPLPEIFDAEQKAVRVSVNTSSLIMEAARRVDEWERMKTVVPSLEEIFLPQPALKEMAQKGELEPLQARILDFLDGGRDLLDVVNESSFSRYEVVKTIVEFQEKGLIRSATLDDLAEAGEMCAKEGRTRHVIKIYERMFAKGVDTPELRARIAEAATELGEVDKAAIHYGVFARHLLDQGNEDHAITILQKIVKLIPKHVPSRKQLARILSARGEIEEAVGHYTALVHALVETRRVEEGLEFAKEGLGLEPDNLDLLQALAHIHLMMKDKTAASGVTAKMGEVLAKTGRTRAAEEMYRRAVQVDPTNEEARAALSKLEELERSRRAKPVLVGILATVLTAVAGGVLVVGGNELAARQAFASTVERYKAGRATDKDLWKAIARPSIYVDPTEGIALLRTKRLETDEQVFVQSLMTKKKRAEIERALSQVEDLYKKHEHAAATPTLMSIASEQGFPDLAGKAQAMLDDIMKTEQYLKDYRRWMEGNEGRPETLRQELERKLELWQRYPWCKEAEDLKLPILVKTLPDGADIYVNGKFRGSSPLPLYYKPGERVEISAVLSGYRTEKKTIAGQWEGVEMVMTMEREAVLTVGLGGEVDIPALFLENLLVVANRSGKILALDRGTGRVVWTFNVSEQGLGDVTSPLTYYSGRIYFGVADGTLRMAEISATGAKAGWSVQRRARTLARPAVKRLELLNQRLFVFACDESGMVTCVEADTGTQVWTAQVGSAVEGALAATERYLYVPTRNGDLMVYESSTGREVRRIPFGSPVSDLLLDGDRLFFCAGKVLYCRPAENPHGGPLWLYKTDREIINRPAMIGQTILVCDGKKLLHCVDMNTGKAVWAPLETNEPVEIAAGGDKKRVYLADKEGTLYSISSALGRLRWTYTFRRPITVPPMFSGGKAYIITKEGTLSVFEDGGE